MQAQGRNKISWYDDHGELNKRLLGAFIASTEARKDPPLKQALTALKDVVIIASPDEAVKVSGHYGRWPGMPQLVGCTWPGGTAYARCW